MEAAGCDVGLAQDSRIAWGERPARWRGDCWFRRPGGQKALALVRPSDDTPFMALFRLWLPRSFSAVISLALVVGCGGKSSSGPKADAGPEHPDIGASHDSAPDKSLRIDGMAGGADVSIGDDAGAHGAADVGTDVAADSGADVAGNASADVAADSGADVAGNASADVAADSGADVAAGGFGEDAGDASDGGDGGGACSPAPTLPLFAGTPTLQFVVGAQVSTLAGSDVSGGVDGQGAAASFDNPVSIAVGLTGDLFVADYDSGLLRRVTETGAVTTVANLAGLQPFGLVATRAGQLFVDTDHDPNGAKSATTGTIWSVDPSTGQKVAVRADIGSPRGVAQLADGRLVLGDFRNHVVLLLNPTDASLAVLAGSGCPGFADGRGTSAAFNSPYGLVVAPDGRIIVADAGNGRIRVLDLNGNVTTLAGGDTLGTNDGPVSQALFYRPVDVASDVAGNLYVSDNWAHRIRRIDAAGNVMTLAGNGTAGFADGSGASAEFYGQEGLDVLSDGSAVFVADGNSGDGGPYNRIRKVDIPAAIH
jgi:sugar lactone lactonase YvrE